MPMPRKVHCVRCGGHVSDVGRLSARKVCQACGEAAVLANAVQLAERSGPYFDRWRRALVLALMNLNTDSRTSLDLISDETLSQLLSGAEADALR